MGCGDLGLQRVDHSPQISRGASGIYGLMPAGSPHKTIRVGFEYRRHGKLE